MKLKIFSNKDKLAAAAATQASEAIGRAIRERGAARIIAATGASQLHFLEQLSKKDGIDWQRVEMFHLDEYIGIPISHPASFRKYLLERLIKKVGIERYYLLDGEQEPGNVIAEMKSEIHKTSIDVTLIKIEKNK